MAWGMTVAPSIPAASSTLCPPAKAGTSPATVAPASGGRTNNPATNPTATTASMPVIMRSKRRCPCRAAVARTTTDTAVVISPPASSGSPNSSCSATAPPSTSARSVATHTTSACSQ